MSSRNSAGERAPGPPLPSGSRVARGNWLLPVFLVILPILAGIWEWQRFDEFAGKGAQGHFQQLTDPVAAKLVEVTSTAFWPGEMAKRLRARVEGILPRISSIHGGLGRVIAREVPRGTLRGAPPIKVWAVEVATGSVLTAELCRDKGLQSHKGYVFRMLLEETLRRNWRPAGDGPAEPGDPERPSKDTFPARSGPSVTTLDKSFKALFGSVVTLETFAPAFRGRPLAVSFEDTYGYIVWEIIEHRGKPRGAFLMFYPSGLGDEAQGLKLTLANWTRGDLRPAFLELPYRLGAARQHQLIHPDLIRGQPLEVVSRLQTWMRITPPTDLKVDGLGRVWLPNALEGRVFRHGEWWYRVCSLSPECGYIGILMGRVRTTDWVPLGRAGLMVGALLTCGLWLFLRRPSASPPSGREGRGRPGPWNDLGIRESLLLWFFGLLAVPVVFGVGEGAIFLINHQENLKTVLQQEMQAALAGIDSESSRLVKDQEALARTVTKDRTWQYALRDAQLARNKEGIERVKEDLWRRFQAGGMKPTGLILMGHRSFTTIREETLIGRTAGSEIIDLAQSLWGSSLGPETPTIREAFDRAARSRSTEPASEGDFAPRRRSSTLEMISGRLMSNAHQGMSFYTPKRLWFGKSQAMTLAAPVVLDGCPWFLLGLVWDQGAAYQSFLERRIPEITRLTNRAATPYQIVALRERGGMSDPVGSNSVSPASLKLIRKVGFRKTSIVCDLDGSASLLCFHPSLRMNGILLVASASLDRIGAQVLREAAGMILLLAFALVLAAGAAAILSRWLASPLIRMSRGLEQIAGGNLAVAVAEDRADEIGTAGLALDGMTRSLRERRNLSSFVAPQVLEAVAGGNPGTAMEGRKRQVVVLSSDIRSFTTISERFSPQEVFAALNDHLKVMTAVIQDAGGVIDRFIGDAIVAVFYPVAGPGPEERALAAARTMMRAHGDLVSDRQRAGRFGYAIGIGIDSGLVVAGVLGDETVRLDYSVLGETVSHAAHLESLTKKGRSSRIVVSGRVRDRLPSSDRFLPVEGEGDAWELEAVGSGFGMITEPCPLLPDSAGDPGRPGPDSAGGAPRGTQSPPIAGVVFGSREGEGKEEKDLGEFCKPREDPEKRAVDPGTSHRLGSSLAWFLLFWALPLVLVGIATVKQAGTAQDRGIQDLSQRLEERSFKVREALDPEIGLSQDLSRHLDEAVQRAGQPQYAPNYLDGIPQEISRALASFTARFPGFQWVYTEYSRPPTSTTASLDHLRFETLDPGGGADPSAGLIPDDPSGVAGPAWVSTNIGIAGDAPPLVVKGEEIRISGGGLGFMTASGSFHLRHRSLPSHCRFTARIRSLEMTHPEAMVGLMARQSEEPDSPAVCLYLTAEGMVGWAAPPGEPLGKTRPGEAASQTNSLAGPGFPLWLRLTRQADEWLGEFSRDGQTWQVAGRTRRALGTGPRGGLAVTGGLRHNFLSPRGSRVRARHGFSSETDSELVRLCLAGDLFFIGSVFGHPFVLDKEFRSWGDGTLPAMLDDSFDPTIFFTEIHNEPQLVTFRGKRVLASHRPLERGQFLAATTCPLSPEGRPAAEDQVSRRFHEYRHNSIGALFLVADLGQDWLQAAGVPLLEGLASEGFQAALLPADGLPGEPVLGAEFAPGGGLHQIIAEPVSGIRRVADWVVLVGSPLPLMDRQVRIVLAGRVPLLANFLRLSWWPWFFFGLWTLGGVGWLLGSLFPRGIPRVALAGRLLGIFLVTLFPTLFLASRIMDRSALEIETRLLAEGRTSLFHALEQFDHSQGLAVSWIRNLLRREISASGLARIKAGASFETQANRQLRTLATRVIRKGLTLENLVMFNSPGDFASFCTKPDWGEVSRESISLSLDIFRNLGWKDSGRDPGKGSARDETQRLFIQSEIESYLVSWASSIGMEKTAEVFQRPEFWGEWNTGESSQDQTYLRELPPNMEIRSRVKADFLPGTTERILCSGVASPPPGLALPASEFLFVRIDQARESVEAPLFTMSAEGPILHSPTWLAKDLPAGMREANECAVLIQEPVPRILTGPEGDSWNIAFPCQNVARFLIIGRLFHDRLLATVREKAGTQRGVLVGVLILIIVLARLVARRFLVPVEGLVRACQIVTGGDYTVRLPTTWSGEFRSLADAFNKMAGEAMEGRLLGRFVSDSARAVARGGSLDAGVPEGESREAVIVFAQLAGFKDLLEGTSPDALIQNLNSYLKAMSRVIRDHGGEIDKFIGDKILAVFHVTPQTDLGAAAARALLTARDLREAMKGRPGGFDAALGVGVVAGPVLAGILGTPALRLEFTVIGDTVNLASRLADLAAALPQGGAIVEGGTAALVSAASQEAGLPRLVPLPPVRVKGKTAEIGIFRLE